MFRGIRTVMVFVDDPKTAATWWADYFGRDVRLDVNGQAVYAWIDLDGLEFGFHQASPRNNPHGRSTVPYWAVDDLDTERTKLLDAGCTHLRGPLDVEADRRICQLVDPFGTVFGLDGP